MHTNSISAKFVCWLAKVKEPRRGIFSFPYPVIISSAAAADENICCWQSGGKVAPVKNSVAVGM